MADPILDFSDFLDKYEGHRPTSFDSHICSELDSFYVGPCSQTRDSDTLTRVNFEIMTEAVLKVAQHSETEVHRFGHWGPGWYELLLIHPADTAALAEASEIAASLENYGCLNDERWAEVQYDEAANFWDRMNIQDRIDVLARFNLSIFAARRDCLPDDPCGGLVDYLADGH